MIAYEYGGLWKHKFPEGVEIGFYFRVFPPGKIRHVSNHWHFGIIGGYLGNRAEIVRGADKADLDDLDRNIFQDGAGLFGHGVFVEGKVIENLGSVARIGACHHREQVRADGSNCERIAGQSASPARVAGIERQDTGQAGVFIVIGVDVDCAGAAGQRVVRNVGLF